MQVNISGGMKISVVTYYQENYSNPYNHEFMFAYRITIENQNTFSVKLHSRHWFVFDSNVSFRDVEGQGVLGIQPVISPGSEYEYVSGCNLQTEIGRMHGTYLMENLSSKELFEVDIPTFYLTAPFKYN